ncbi:MAG TPA: hypothetical protein DD727_04430 [Clostridiales bacterium]|nr:hypothetical protein [Clostridiales bacterium]
MYDESEKVSQEIGRVNRANKNQRSQPHNQPNHQPHNQPYVAEPKTGRNDPCPCGSGKKYKKCCESR